MAEGVAIESLLSKAILGHLECSICCTRYNQPKNLDCSHSYCLKCLQELKKSQNPDTDKLTCPLCQKETILPPDGVTGLQNNYPLNALVEEVNKQEQLLQGEESKVICQACDEENAAISRCLNCEHYLCQECQKAHQRFPALKNHEIKTLAELQEVDKSRTESKMNISRCDIHPIQELCLYCMTCEQLICKVCADLRHKEPVHNLVNLQIAFEICQISVLQLHQSEIAGNIATMRKRLSWLFQETNTNISLHAEKNINQIKLEETQLKQKAQAMYQRKDKKLAELEFAEQTMKTIRTRIQMTDVNRLEILKNREELLHSYRDINIHEDQEDLTYDLSFIAFSKVENEVELGTLLHKEKWELMSQVEFDSRLVSSYYTGDILAVKDSQIKILRPNGKDLNTICQLECKDLSHPTAIAVNNEDHHIVLDNPNVKTFSEEFQLLHQFTPGKESGSEPTCLAVDENNLIAVGYKDKGEVSLHNPDGSLIRTLSAPGIHVHMTMNNQRIIYTHTQNKKLTGVDYQGNNIIQQDITDSIGMVCCDKAGDIYVLYSQRIQHLSAMGIHVQWINMDKKCNYTCNITFTQNGELAVNQKSFFSYTLKIYHRV